MVDEPTPKVLFVFFEQPQGIGRLETGSNVESGDAAGPAPRG
jgi:hypothetical protein